MSMVVEAKDSYEVMLLPGDGIGPEITAATVNALEPLQSLFKINFKEVGGLVQFWRLGCFHYFSRKSYVHDVVALLDVGYGRWPQLDGSNFLHLEVLPASCVYDMG